jgi:uncharacterized protein YbjT (DUF2867 family)
MTECDCKATDILVLCATGKQGSSVCEALASDIRFIVHGLTRNTKKNTARKIENMGVHLVEGDVNSQKSIEAALKATSAKHMFLVTLMGTRASEVAAGKAAIDAATNCGVEFIVYSSVADADNCHENVAHFKAKLDIENYLKSTPIKYGILRPVAFLDIYDDVSIYNPLTRGSIKGLFRSDLKVKHVACRDVGKAAACIFSDPNKFSGRTINCVSCDVSGQDLAKALTSASGELCSYSVADEGQMSVMITELGQMISYFEEKGGYSCTDEDIAEFKKVATHFKYCSCVHETVNYLYETLISLIEYIIVACTRRSRC